MKTKFNVHKTKFNVHKKLERLKSLIAVARGVGAPDLVLKGGSVVDVFSGELITADVAVYDGRIAGVVGPMFPEAAEILGLHRYLQSLKQLRRMGMAHPDMQVFPAHRLYYGGQWNVVDLTQRIDELIEHHVQRCAAIVDIVSRGHGTVEEIVQRHFESSLLQGPGKHMAINEILSHCELLVDWGDLVETGGHQYEASGTRRFETLISTLE